MSFCYLPTQGPILTIRLPPKGFTESKIDGCVLSRISGSDNIQLSHLCDFELESTSNSSFDGDELCSASAVVCTVLTPSQAASITNTTALLFNPAIQTAPWFPQQASAQN
jgi:hypothetical protein